MEGFLSNRPLTFKPFGLCFKADVDFELSSPESRAAIVSTTTTAPRPWSLSYYLESDGYNSDFQLLQRAPLRQPEPTTRAKGYDYVHSGTTLRDTRGEWRGPDRRHGTERPILLAALIIDPHTGSDSFTYISAGTYIHTFIHTLSLNTHKQTDIHPSPSKPQVHPKHKQTQASTRADIPRTPIHPSHLSSQISIPTITKYNTP